MTELPLPDDLLDADEADAAEQLTDAEPDTDEAGGTPRGRSPRLRRDELWETDEVDAAEQAQEIPLDEDDWR
ncbi:MAG: hypothetical protein ACJ73S_18195 [Mycobacteriales bacterium]